MLLIFAKIGKYGCVDIISECVTIKFYYFHIYNPSIRACIANVFILTYISGGVYRYLGYVISTKLEKTSAKKNKATPELPEAALLQKSL